MIYSFRTNGNFIEFVHTDNTSLQVQNILKVIHNTSRCITWSLPEDTTRISFVVDDIRVDGFPLSEIDFDGVAIDSQDDFETGIIAAFPGLAGGGTVGSSSPDLVATVELNNAEIIAASNGAPVSIITAVGTGKMPLFVRAVVISSITTPYASIGASATAYFRSTINGTGVSGDIPNDAGAGLTSFTNQFTNDGTISIFPPYGDLITGWYDVIAQQSNKLSEENAGIEFYINNGGSFSGGHADNTIKIVLYYKEVDL